MMAETYNESEEWSLTTATSAGHPQQENDEIQSTTKKELVVFIIGIIGIIGNSLVLVVLATNKKYSSRVCNILVINQSTVDLISCICFIMTYASRAMPKMLAGRSGLWICFLFDSGLIMWNFINTSGLCLLAITLERYMIVVHPVFHRNSLTRNKVIAVAAICWLVPLILNFPIGFSKSGLLFGYCIPFLYLPRWANNLYVLVTYTLYVLVPMGAMIICYSHMLVIMKERLNAQALVTLSTSAATTNNAGSSTRSKLSNKQVNLTKTMVVVSLAFIICLGPVNTRFVVSTFSSKVSFLSQTHMILTYLALANSSINPFIYAFKYEDFKTGSQALFCRKHSAVVPSSVATVSTNLQ